MHEKGCFKCGADLKIGWVNCDNCKNGAVPIDREALYIGPKEEE